MPSSPTARDAAEGLAEIEAEIVRIMRDELDWPEDKDPDDATGDVLARIAKRLAVLRSAGTEGGETQGAAFRVGRRVPENVYRDGRPWLSAGSPERAARIVTTCEASGTKSAQIDYAVRAFHADLDRILAGGPSGTRTIDGGEA